MTENYQDMINKLPTLTASELKKLKLTADYLMNGAAIEQSVNGVDAEDDLLLLYQQLGVVLLDKGIKCPQWYIFQRLKPFKLLQDKFPGVEEYTKRYFGTVNRRQRQKLYRVYMTVLVQWVEGNPYLPLSIATVIRNLDHFQEAMANAFPGYAQSGLLPMILELGDRERNVEE